MKRIDLCGHWEAVRIGGAELFPATVPGCVHTDLLSAGLIEDPFFRDNERNQYHIGGSGWSFSRVFVVDAEFLSEQRIMLRWEGPDTPAAILINDGEIARQDGLFRTRELDVKDRLREGENEIRVDFDPPVPDNGAAERDMYPMIPTCGIRRPIGLVGWSAARLGDVRVLQDHGKRNAVGLDVQVSADRAEKRRATPLRAEVTVGLEGEQVARSSFDLPRGRGESKIVIRQPRLWWPNGMGEQPLYDVTVALFDPDGAVLDRQEMRIGLRTLRLDREPDEWGGSFRFVVNGKPFFAKGADWIPADAFATGVTPEQYEYLVGSARDANMNMLRVRDGGVHEHDVFYDLCDRYGICVWQDFPFAGAAFRADDSVSTEDVKREAEAAVRRLRRHACLALWCGDGRDGGDDGAGQAPGFDGGGRVRGSMSRAEYRKLFDRMLPSIVAGLDPGRDYRPAGPPSCGVDPAEHRFCCEPGFPSFPEPRVVDSFTFPEDRNLGSRIMELHQRGPIGNDALVQHLLQWFLLPSSFDMQIRLSQILQGLAVKAAVEHARRSRPRCMGTLYRRLNDCRPAPGPSSIDYRGNWKALHYFARDFYAPLLVSGVTDPAAGTVDVHVCSDLAAPVSGMLAWSLFLTDGTPVARDELGIRAAASTSRRVTTLKLREHLREHGERNLLLRLELSADGQRTSRDLVLFDRPKHLSLRDPEILASVEVGPGDGFTVALKASRPALWVWTELADIPAAFSDRFFHLVPDRIIEVRVLPAVPMSADQLLERLRVTSLFDTCPEYRSAMLRRETGRTGEAAGAAASPDGSPVMRISSPAPTGS